MAVGQLDLAIEVLEGLDDAGAPERAVHETRKALKRLRALLRLLEPNLGEEVYAREDAAIRDAGRRLSGSRDAEVLLATLDGLIESHPGKLAGRGGVARLRAHLSSERDGAWRSTLADSAARVLTLEELRACRVRVAAWEPPQRHGVELVQPGFIRVYRQGRRRHRRAAHGRGERTLALHRWRKRVKDLRYAAEMLDRSDPASERKLPSRHGARRRKQAAKRARAQLLRKLARRADKLGEALGEEHDLAVLAGRIRAQEARRPAVGEGGQVRLGRRNRKAMLKLIARRRRKLRTRTLREGARLYRRRPRRFVRRVRRAFARASVSRR
jgi:CHAD domain-containing protein